MQLGEIMNQFNVKVFEQENLSIMINEKAEDAIENVD
jgi:hypothetical protein